MTDQAAREGELILYRTADGTVRAGVLYESETFWLDQPVYARTASSRTTSRLR